MPRSGLLLLVALFPACDAVDQLVEANELEEAEPAGYRTKDEGGSVPDFNLCDGATLCVAGEGDCDFDFQCEPGLACGFNNGVQFGQHWTLDVCVAATCTNGVQDGLETSIDIGDTCGPCGGENGDNEGYCSVGCPCLEGEGDCDSNAECAPGLTCHNKQGDRYPPPLDGFDGVCIDTLTIAQMQVGDVIITEIMDDPSSVTDGFGEWFEVFNTTNIPIDLEGLLVRHNAGALNFTVTGSLVIQPQGYLVFAKNGNTAVNGGVTADFDYDNTFALNNTTDSIILDNGPLDIDRVIYNATFPNPVGSSMELDIQTYTSTSNDVGGNWCSSITPLSGGDNGTPGADNQDC